MYPLYFANCPILMNLDYSFRLFWKSRPTRFALRPATAGIYGSYIPKEEWNMLKLLPATTGIYWWYIPLWQQLLYRLMPATAGIYWWCIPISYLIPHMHLPATAGVLRGIQWIIQQQVTENFRPNCEKSVKLDGVYISRYFKTMYIIILALFLNLIACNSRYLLVVYTSPAA